jgi:hypothetical protein
VLTAADMEDRVPWLISSTVKFITEDNILSDTFWYNQWSSRYYTKVKYFDKLFKKLIIQGYIFSWYVCLKKKLNFPFT